MPFVDDIAVHVDEARDVVAAREQNERAVRLRRVVVRRAGGKTLCAATAAAMAAIASAKNTPRIDQNSICTASFMQPFVGQLRLRWRRDRLLLGGIARVAPLFERVTPFGQAVEFISIDVRSLVDFRVFPPVLDRQVRAVRRENETLRQMCFRCPVPTGDDAAGHDADGIDDELAIFKPPHRVS